MKEVSKEHFDFRLKQMNFMAFLKNTFQIENKSLVTRIDREMFTQAGEKRNITRQNPWTFDKC